MGVKATSDKPKKIIVSWNKTSSKDFDYYKVYRKRFFWQFYGKTKNNTFIDKIDDDGVSREYKVTMVDKDGLESLDSAIIRGTTLPKPLPPKIDLIKMSEKYVVLNWHSMDRRVKYFTIVKNGKVLLNNIEKTTFIDRDVEAGKEYGYSIIGIDKFGLVSKPSDEAEIFLPNIVKED